MLKISSRTLARDEEGVAAIEFAIAAPVVFALMFGTVELGWMAFAKSQLESSVTAAAREAISGATTIEIDPSTNKPYTRDKMIQKRVRTAMDEIPTINMQIVANDPTQGNPRIFVTPYASVASGGEGFSRVRQPEPMNDINLNGTCDNAPVPNGMGGTSRETYRDANGNQQWDNGGNFGGAGAPGDIVVYDIQVDSPLLFGGFIPIGSVSNGSRQNYTTLKSQVVVQNEIYAVASANARIWRYCDGSKVN